MAINKMMGFMELQHQHDMFSDDFTALYYDILLNMMLEGTNQNMFSSRPEYIKYIKYRIDRLIYRSPPIPSSVRERYNKQYYAKLQKQKRDLSRQNSQPIEIVIPSDITKLPKRRYAGFLSMFNYFCFAKVTKQNTPPQEQQVAMQTNAEVQTNIKDILENNRTRERPSILIHDEDIMEFNRKRRCSMRDIEEISQNLYQLQHRANEFQRQQTKTSH